MKTVFYSLCIILFLFSCNVVDAPTGSCKWGPLKQYCTETTAADCRKTFSGDWSEGEDCPIITYP